jgi:hypothetical protein
VIVYGDPHYTVSRATVRARLQTWFEAARGGADSARDLVIALGQIEQGIADAESNTSALTAIMEATDRAAEFFVWQNLGKRCGLEVLVTCRHSALRALEGEGTLQIKIPEGFAFYSLFPEQYLTAAEIYSVNRRITKTLVVGIRSIGTSLSAIVKAALNARGFHAERITVRPKGHPFARETHLEDSPHCDAVIIVDEGPGLSGSSLASVAAAFRARGVKDITFLPGHANPPGDSASIETKRIWSETPTMVEPLLNDLNSSPVTNILRRETEKILGAPVCAVKDLSAGAWARLAKATASITAPQFERTKFLIECAKGRSLIWKFAGLGPGANFENLTSTALARQHSLSAQGWCYPALAGCYGFIATEWLELPHPSCPPDDSTCAQLAQYIIAASKPPLTELQTENAINRLREMMIYNFEESGLHNVAAAAKRLKPDIQALSKLASYGDGRMALYEFLTSSGKLLKTDIWGHDSDHTMIGQQPILWDIAGALIEWKLPPNFTTHFEGSSVQIRAADLIFYLYAYTAFRIGMTSLAADSEGLARYRKQATAVESFFPVSSVRQW